jgi:branched-chain amino acid transport system substrate-binding protein
VKKTALIATALLATAALAGCATATSGGGEEETGPIRLGMVVPLTGPYAALGTADKAAAEQLVDAINADGGILGREVELTVNDDKTDVTQSVTEYNQLAADPGISLIFSSSFVSASTATGPSAQSSKVPTLALGPVSAFADGSNPYAFTVPATPAVYAKALVDYFDAEGIDSLAIAYVGTDVYGQTGNEATVAAAEEAGIEILLDEPYDQGATDFAPLVSKVKESGADGFLVWGAGPAPVIITKQLEGQGVRTFMTGAQASNLYVEPSGTAAEGVVLSSSIAVPGAELPAGPLKDTIDQFAGPWEKENGVYPPQFAFDGAAGIQLAQAAIEAAGSSDREAIRNALESLDVLTVVGRYTYSATNHSGLDSSAIAIVEVSGGAFIATDYAKEQFLTSLPKQP